MRWLLIALFVSLVGLLMAVAGMVFHVWLHHHRPRSKSSASAEETIDSPRSQSEKTQAKMRE
jgi:uncharacterized membrane protein